MRYTNFLLASALVMGACKQGGHEGHVDDLDEEWLLEIKAENEKYSDIMELMKEFAVAANGCPIPKWFTVHGYWYHPETLDGMGIHVLDITYPIDQYEEARPRMLMYHMNDKAEYELAGLEWYYEPPGAEAVDPPPTLFGVQMEGVMQPHIIDVQGVHYDLHAWVWKTSPDNYLGYFNEFNKGMTAPDWWYEGEAPMNAAFKFYAPDAPDALGYGPTGECIRTAAGDAGFPRTNPDLVGLLDPFQPDTYLHDVNGMPLGVQWTAPDDGNGAPTLFGQPMTSDGEGNYVMRMWMGLRTSTKGFLHPTIDTFSCDEPALPAECVGGMPF